MKRKQSIWVTLLILGILAPAFADEAVDQPVAAPKPAADAPASSGPRIQVALLLDTSNSMDGLINQARTQLWKIVNEFAKAKRDGQRPDLQVALFEYGKSSIDAQAGYLRQIVPLTDDLDKVSDELFALTTNGGREYCGMVIEAATERLKWSTAEADLKCIFVAGNEPFTQGSVDPYKACQAAIEKGITVNTIHCGPYQVGVNTGWQQGARLADGSYVNIDQNKAVAAINAPQDADLARLSAELNKTYVFYGAAEERRNRALLQRKQDQSAQQAAPGAAATRAATKAGSAYRNSRFDLVDAVKEKKVNLEKLPKEQLPEELKDKSADEIRSYVATKQKERAAIAAQIKELSAARDKYVAAERKKLAEAAGEEEADTLDTAVIRVIREQAQKRQFEFEKE